MSETSIDEIVSRECESFERVLKADMKSQGTVREYLGAVEQMLRHLDKAPADLTAEDMEGFRQWVAGKYGQNTAYIRVTAVNQYTKRMLRKPDLMMKAPGMVKTKKFPLTEDEIKAIQKAADDSRMSLRNRALIDTMYYAGLRCDEVCHLSLSSLELKTDPPKMMVVCGKGKKDRVIPMRAELVQSITAYMKKGRKPKDPKEQRLFLSMDGKPIGGDVVLRWARKLAFEAGVSKRVYPHLFRTTIAVHLKDQGFSMTQIKAFMGHESILTTERYIPESYEDLENKMVSTFMAKTPEEPARPIPKVPTPRTTVAPMSQHLTHEDILRARLDGKIDTMTMETMLGHVDRGPSPPPIGYQ